MNCGVMVPQFRETPDAALQLVDAAERSAIDGVFVSDHLWWPFGDARGISQSALPLIGAIASRAKRMTVGTLVARVGVADNDLLLSQLISINEIAEGRFVAGLGIGDQLSLPENVAYGVAFHPRPVRLRMLEELTAALLAEGIAVWLGGKSDEIREVAETTGAVVNQWNADVDELLPTDTWAGEFVGRDQIESLREVPWAVFLISGSGANPIDSVAKLDSALSDPPSL